MKLLVSIVTLVGALGALALVVAWLRGIYTDRPRDLTLIDRLHLLVSGFAGEFGGSTLAAADAVLKEDYKGPVVDLLNNFGYIIPKLKRNTEDIIGRRAVIPLHTSRNDGVGARGEREALPTPGQQGYEDIFIPLRYNYVTIELTGPVVRATRSDRGSFVRAMRSEMDGAVTDGKRDLSRQAWGTSDGRIAECGITTASNDVVIDGMTETQEFHLWGRVDIGTVADPDAVAANRTITAVDRDAGTITISGAAVTTTAAHSVFRAGAGGASDNSGRPGDGQREITGLQHIIDDDSILHTLDPADVPQWAAYVEENGGVQRSISQNLVTKTQMKANRAGGRRASLVVGGDGVVRSYGNLLLAQKRFVNEVNLDGGFTGISVGAPGANGEGSMTQTLVIDWDAPSNSLYGISLSDLTWFTDGDWDWMDDDGAVLNRVDGYDAYNAVLYLYAELANTGRRQAHWVIRDITEAD